MMIRFTTLLLAMTALSPVALAQSDATAPQPTAAACLDLLAVIEAGDLDPDVIARDDAIAIVGHDDDQTCIDTMRVARGEISAQPDDPTYDADAIARLRVVVPEPEVTVTQEAPQVTVSQPDPQVTVTPGRPLVTVTQAEPVVRVQTTPPTITIDMPRPTIVVEMPDPTVDVAMAQPRVTVEQSDPTVRVDQGEVSVQMGDAVTQPLASGQSDASVTVVQDQASVVLEDSEGPQITIGETTPQVRYQAAEPRVEFEQTGEPQVRFRQTGEADVQIRQMSAAESASAMSEGQLGTETEEAVAAALPDDQPSVDGAQTDTAATTTSQGATSDRFAVLDQPEQTVDRDLQDLSVDELIEMEVVGADGETIGDVDRFVWYQDHPYMVVAHGGFLGFGERQVALHMAGLVVRDGRIHMLQITQERVEQMREVDVDQFQDVQTGQQIAVRVE